MARDQEPKYSTKMCGPDGYISDMSSAEPLAEHWDNMSENQRRQTSLLRSLSQTEFGTHTVGQ